IVFFVYIVGKGVGGSIDSLGYKVILKTAIHVNKHVHHLLNISIIMQVHMQMNMYTGDTLLKRGNICCNNWDMGCRTEMGQLFLRIY
ncbi:MAG: hypothetical protein KAQ84_04745, partial [Thermoplasmatales archaeon]|nr:hypothetical protein [Thermoplasmatales archaeon]